MLIRVMYTDYNYDYVDTGTLNRLIAFKRIKKFVRPSEEAWIDIDCGPIRGANQAGAYIGSERRSGFTEQLHVKINHSTH
jgi:uncharacterized protein with von Willebrand factor type A (vWA) domain